MAWTPLPESVTVTFETPQPKELTLDPAKTAVVVVDMQNTFCKTGNERSYDVIEGNVRLLGKAREAGARVIYVQSVRQLESPEYTMFNRQMRLLIGTWNTQIVDEIAPLPGEPVVQKWSHDVWAWYGMEALLEREGVIAGEWTVLVTGVSAAQCAHAAALGFSNRHYRTLIPMDCTAASVEAEARTDHQYQTGGYNHNVDFTLSTLVSFAPAGVTAAEKELVAAR
jgi:ureidoacrylate peracid hydrolase